MVYRADLDWLTQAFHHFLSCFLPCFVLPCLEGVWECNIGCFSKYFLLGEIHQNNIIFLKIIFNIKTLKKSKNKKRLILSKNKILIFGKHSFNRVSKHYINQLKIKQYHFFLLLHTIFSPCYYAYFIYIYIYIYRNITRVIRFF
jgi:hypothetical protein